MDTLILEVIGSLEMILDDLPYKPKITVEEIITCLKNMEELLPTELIKVQDELELVSNMSNIDSFSRNTILNAISEIGTLM